MTGKARAVPEDHPLRGSARPGTTGTGAARKPKRTHAFQADPQLGKDASGKYEICFCGLPAENQVHDLPRRHSDEVAREQRRMGERR